MILNGIDFPNQIIDSICENQLVVFAGAGASVDAPTSLPNFENLAKEIAEGTGSIYKKGTPCEVFLGSLKARGVDVNKQAAEITSKSCLEHNKLHEAIVDLFIDYEKTKIVTTNYDQMFEHVFKSRGLSVNVYNVPALPLGDDVEGIVHIHGNVNNPKYMVVTDEDFGKAYLTDGYAARFLIKLFESYTVLFVGYSYADTILRYLTRAMPRNKSLKRYILTDDNKSDWDALGMTAIYFPKRSYAVMREGLFKLGIRSKKGFIDLKNQFTDIKNMPPKDLTIDSEIEYCLEDVERSQLLANCIQGRDWMNLLDRKKVFDGCFSTNEVTEKDLIWAQWLCKGFVGIDDEALYRLILSHGNVINSCLVKDLLWRIFNSKLSDEAFKSYIMILDSHIIEPSWIFRLVEDAAKRNLYTLGFYLFQKLYALDLKLEKQLIFDVIQHSHCFCGQHYQIQKSWELIGNHIIDSSAVEVLTFVKGKIEELHIKYETVGQASDYKEPWKLLVHELEEEERHLHDDPIYLLPDIFVDAALSLQKSNRSALKEILLLCVNSKSPLLRRIGLLAIRKCEVHSPSEKLQIVLDENMMWDPDYKQQVFYLVADVFNKLTSLEQGMLLDNIDKGCGSNCDSDSMSDAYEVYNWYVWLQRVNTDNTRINKKLRGMSNKYGFSPRDYPERNMVISSGSKPEISPVSEKDLMGMEIVEAVKYLCNYEGDRFNGPGRWGLLTTLEKCIKNEYSWTIKVLRALSDEGITKDDIWSAYFQGVRGASFTIEEKINIYEQVIKSINIIPNDRGLADCILSIVEDNDFKACLKPYEERLLTITETIWAYRKQDSVKLEKIIDTAFNSTTGIILYVWIRMLAASDNESLFTRYKEHFEGALAKQGRERNIAICVLAGHYNFFCLMDKDWCTKTFNSMLAGGNKNEYISAWEGMVYFSGRIYKDTADMIAPIYLKAISHIRWLSEDVRHRFIELFLILLIYVVEKPTLKYLPKFYKTTEADDQEQFIKTIEQRLRGMNKTEKIAWWNSWLKHFLENRKRNKPIELSDRENRAIFDLLPELKEVFDDAVDVICQGKIPADIDELFWYSLKEMNIAAEESKSMARLLIKLLKENANIRAFSGDISDIVKELNNVEDQKMKQLQELMIRRNIDLERQI